MVQVSHMPFQINVERNSPKKFDKHHVVTLITQIAMYYRTQPRISPSILVALFSKSKKPGTHELRFTYPFAQAYNI